MVRSTGGGSRVRVRGRRKSLIEERKDWGDEWGTDNNKKKAGGFGTVIGVREGEGLDAGKCASTGDRKWCWGGAGAGGGVSMGRGDRTEW
eukprot:11388910-Ditylum_brightwellii.AAC.1